MGANLSPSVSSTGYVSSGVTSIQGQLRKNVENQLTRLANLPENSPESAKEGIFSALRGYVEQAPDDGSKAEVRDMIKEGMERRGKSPEETMKTLEHFKILGEGLEFGAEAGAHISTKLAATLSEDSSQLSGLFEMGTPVFRGAAKAASKVAPVAVAAMAHSITQAPLEKQGEKWLGFTVSVGAGLAMAKAGAAVTPGGPLAKAGVAAILTVVGSLVGDAAVKNLVENHPDMKAFLSSKPVMAGAYAVLMADPMNLASMTVDSTIRGMDLNERMSFVAKNGPEAWDTRVQGQINGINTRIAFATERGNTREVTNLTSQRSRLEGTMYNINKNGNLSPSAVADVEGRVIDEAASWVRGDKSASAAVHG